MKRGELFVGNWKIYFYIPSDNSHYSNLPDGWVDFHFKVKSSAMKILSTKKDVADIKFLYYTMQTIDISYDTHKRYWISTYSKCVINVPPLSEQQRIVSKIEQIFAQLDEIKKSIK